MPDPSHRVLLLIPTYNERDNIETLYAQIRDLRLDLDLLLIDDDSPDGTGAVLDAIAREDPRVQVVHRAGKQGVGSAHLDGIRRAYASGYEVLVTMDADLTHSPRFIPVFLGHADAAPLVVGSRFLEATSLSDWNIARRLTTKLGHVLTRRLLAVPYDATGAFRLYRLDRIPEQAFAGISATGYDFFFESLFVLCRQGVDVDEISIPLPKRTYGHSKMRPGDVAGGVVRLVRLWLRRMIARPARGTRVTAASIRVDNARD